MRQLRFSVNWKFASILGTDNWEIFGWLSLEKFNKFQKSISSQLKSDSGTLFAVISNVQSLSKVLTSAKTYVKVKFKIMFTFEVSFDSSMCSTSSLIVGVWILSLATLAIIFSGVPLESKLKIKSF